MNRDLTVGKPESVLWRYCLPLFGSVLFQQFYNIADSLIAGKFIGEAALAAVGNSYEVTLIFIAFAFGCNIGGAVITAQFFGAKDFSGMKTAVYTTCIAGALLCGVVMAAGGLWCDKLLELLHTPAEVFSDSGLYLEIYIWNLPFVFFYNIATGVFSALGDSKTPFLFLAFSSLSNIGVDVLFVTAFGMGVAGVAWATLICQAISCALAVAVMFCRLRSIRHSGRAALFSLRILKRIATIALPSIAQQSFISIGNIVIQGAINAFGTSIMAGYSAAIKMNNLVITSFTTIGNGISNFTAQNIGADRPERIRAGFRAGVKLVWLLSVPLAVLYFFGGHYAMGLFLDESTTMALRAGTEFLRLLAPFYFVISAKLVADGVLRGAGMMGKFMIATFADLVLRVVLALLLSKTSLGTTGIWCAWPVGWLTAAILSISFYRAGNWCRGKL